MSDTNKHQEFTKALAKLLEEHDAEIVVEQDSHDIRLVEVKISGERFSGCGTQYYFELDHDENITSKNITTIGSPEV